MTIACLTEQAARTAVTQVDPHACKTIAAIVEKLSKRRTSAEAANDAARFITGCYRAKDFVDPELFAIALVSVLRERPPIVVAMAMHPERGVPGRIKFSPNISEVVVELDKIETSIRLVASGAERAQRLLGAAPTADRTGARPQVR